MRIKLDIPLCVKQIAEFCRGVATQREDAWVDHITTDSRESEKNDLFIAITGKNGDGHNFIEDATRRGALTLTQRWDATVRVDDTGIALLRLASKYKSLFRALKATVAITGSVGKTTTKNFLYSIVGRNTTAHATVGNLNNRLGVPFTILSAKADTEILITELGANHAGEIWELAHTAKPDIAIITRIGTSHIGNFGTREMIARAKSEISTPPSVRSVIVPKNEPLLKTLEHRRSFEIGEIFPDGPLADYTLKINHTDGAGSHASFISGIGKFDFYFPVSGIHNLECLGFAVSAALELGFDEKTVKEAIATESNWVSRGEMLNFSDFQIFDDSYNSSIESVLAAFDMLKLKGECVSTALGDIHELGDEAERVHREIGFKIAERGAARIYAYGGYSQFIKEGAISGGMMKENIHTNCDLRSPEVTASQIMKFHEPGEIILLKASNAVNMKAVIKHLRSMEKKRK